MFSLSPREFQIGARCCSDSEKHVWHRDSWTDLSDIHSTRLIYVHWRVCEKSRRDVLSQYLLQQIAPKFITAMPTADCTHAKPFYTFASSRWTKNVN